MKSLHLMPFTLTVFLLTVTGTEAEEIFRQRFLVQGEPVPPALYIRGSEAGTRFSGERSLKNHPFFRNADSGMGFLVEREIWNQGGFSLNRNPIVDQNSVDIRNRRETDLRRGNVEGEALILPLVNRQNMLVVAGPGFMQDSFSGEKNHLLPPLMSGVYGSVFTTSSIGESLYWVSYHSLGSFSDAPTGKSFKYFQLSTFGWKANDAFSVQGGLLIKDFHGETTAIPLAGLAWGNGSIAFRLLLPVSAELRWIIRPDFHLIFEAKGRSSSYFVAGGKSYGRINKSYSHYAVENRILEDVGTIEPSLPPPPDILAEPEAYVRWEFLRRITDPDAYYEFNREEARLGAEVRLTDWTWIQMSLLASTRERIRKKEGKDWFPYGTLSPEARAEFALIVRP